MIFESMARQRIGFEYASNFYFFYLVIPALQFFLIIPVI